MAQGPRLCVARPQRLSGTSLRKPLIGYGVDEKFDSKKTDVNRLPSTAVHPLCEITPATNAAVMINCATILVDYVGSSAICEKMRSESVTVFHKVLSGRGRFRPRREAFGKRLASEVEEEFGRLLGESPVFSHGKPLRRGGRGIQQDQSINLSARRRRLFVLHRTASSERASVLTSRSEDAKAE
jgi:hypothetical protein